MGRWDVGLEPQCLPIVRDGVIPLSLVGENVRKVEVYFRRVRTEPQGRAKMGNGLLCSALRN